MKKIKTLAKMVALSSFILSGCSISDLAFWKKKGNEETEQKEEEEAITIKLDSVSGFTYEDGILSFNPVEGATTYEYVFTHKGEVVYVDNLDVTSLDVESLGLEGNIVLTVTAKCKGGKSDPASYEFSVLSTFDVVKFEAENFLYNFGTGKSDSNFRNNPQASNGAYVGGLDDAGHGIYINYLCPFEGDYKVESAYCYHVTNPSFTQAHHDIWVNGAYQSQFIYTTDTGWGGASFTPDKTDTTIHLLKGWNTISIMKNGDSSDNWGDYAEIDYVTLFGNGEKYNIDDLDEYGVRPAKYRLEAEMGSPRRKFPNGLYQCKNPCIVQDNDHSYSNGFIMGNIENIYDGVEWHFDSPVAAKYRISLCYAAGTFEGCKPGKPAFIVTQEEVGLQKNVDFKDYPVQQMNDLGYPGWNNPTVAEQTFELELAQGDNFIYCILWENSGFFQIDYCDLVFIQEI